MNMSRLRLMAGVGPSMYEGWCRAPEEGAPLVESTEAPGSRRNSSRSQIRRIARMLEDDRMGGRLPVMEGAAEDQAFRQKAHGHSQAAHAASAAADKTGRGSDSAASHAAHSDAAEKHKQAARLAGAQGNNKLAHFHDTKAAHHGKHAAMHKADAGAEKGFFKDEPKHVSVEKDPFKSEPKKAKAAHPEKEKGKKKGLLGRLKDKIIAKVKGAGGIDWAAKSKEIAKKDKKAGKEPSDAEVKAQTRSRAMARIAKRPEYQASKDARRAEKSGSSSDRAKARHRAGDEHLHKALTHFHAGDHDSAVKALNRAIKHKKKAAGHESDVAAQTRQTARRSDPVGPRTQVGFSRR